MNNVKLYISNCSWERKEIKKSQQDEIHQSFPLRDIWQICQASTNFSKTIIRRWNVQDAWISTKNDLKSFLLIPRIIKIIFAISAMSTYCTSSLTFNLTKAVHSHITDMANYSFYDLSYQKELFETISLKSEHLENVTPYNGFEKFVDLYLTYIMQTMPLNSVLSFC